MSEASESIHSKVSAIFRELAGDRALNLEATRLAAAITSTIRTALAGEACSDDQLLHADTIAFHLTDWNASAAFLVALHLFPERFTAEEIREGVEAVLLDVPHHVIAAARLSGYSTEDIFKDSDD